MMLPEPHELAEYRQPEEQPEELIEGYDVPDYLMALAALLLESRTAFNVIALPTVAFIAALIHHHGGGGEAALGFVYPTLFLLSGVNLLRIYV